MQIPISWVNELVKIETIQLDSIIEKLTLGGFEVEDILELEINSQKQTVLDISATANRSDSLSIQGLSAEIAALLNEPAKISKYAAQPKQWKQYLEMQTKSVQIDPNCSIFLAVVVENFSKVNVPKWITQKLLGSGIIPSNDLSDFQNYVLLETGYPFCFYDFEKICTELKTSKLNLSITSNLEKQEFIASNNVNYELDSSILTVNANSIPIGIAGLIESIKFVCSDSTNTLLIEGSVFNAAKIRQQSRKIGLRTDRSARYEKSLKNTYLVDSLYRLISLLRISNPNLVCKLYAISQGSEQHQNPILLRYETINEILGPINQSSALSENYISPALITNYLNRLDFEYIHDEENLTWVVTVPTVRGEDITREIDLIEEIGRLHGFNNFLTKLPKLKTVGREDLNYQTRKKITSCLLNLGLNELIHYSLVNQSTFVDNEIRLVNPLVADYSSLRSTLLPNLIKTLHENLKQKNTSLEGFEFGHVFNTTLTTQFKENEHVACIFGGIKNRLDWSLEATELGWFEAKGKVEQLFKQLNVFPTWAKTSSEVFKDILHPYRSAELYLQDNSKLGVFGQIHPILSNKLNISSEIYLFEFDVEIIKSIIEKNRLISYEEYSTYPKIIKDVSFIIEKNISFKTIKQALFLNGTEFLSEINLLDEYRGSSIPKHQTSLCLQLTFQSNEKTLENKEIENIISHLQLILINKFNAIIRT